MEFGVYFYVFIPLDFHRFTIKSLVLNLHCKAYNRPIVVIAVLYITVNIYNYSGLVVTVTNNLIGLILSRVGRRDLGIYFSD